MLQVLLQCDKITIIEEVALIASNLIEDTQILKIEMDFYVMRSPGMKFSLYIVLIFRLS